MTLKNHNFRNLLVFAAGGLGFSYLLSSLLPQQSYINISAHSVLEACGALTAIVSAIILYQRQAIENRDELKWMISGLFIMGIMDGAHCFTAPGNEFVMFHSLAVFWGGLFFAYSWIPAPKQAKENRRRFFTIIGITLAATLVTINMLSADVTAMLKNGEFTATAKLFNFVGGMGFFAGALYFFQFFSQTRDRRYFWLSLFSCFLGLSGIYFLYGEMWTGGWWLWHMLRLAAFTILMITALVAHHQSIRHLQKALARVEKGRQALQTNEDKHRSMLDAMVDPVYLCSPDLKIDYMNPAMADRIGRDATGEPCHLALHNLHKPCDWCVFEQIKGASPKDITIKSPLDNRTFQITNIPIPNPDGTVSKMTFYRDITDYLDAVSEKEQAQLQLRQAQKLEAVGTLAGGIAHDFNNILFPIIGLTEMLLEKEDDVRSQEDLQEILTAGRRAQTLVSQILAFSRKRQGSLDALDPAPIVKEVLKLARSTLPSNITIIQEIAADAGPVMADAAQLHQVVMNLISNAFHAMETSGGTLTVVLGKPADIPGHLSGRLSQWLCLSVADTGTGILPDIMDRIFDPYFTTKSQDKGSGLGLAVTHGIVKSFGGEIKADSVPGEGSSFNIYLPLTDVRETTPADEPPAMALHNLAGKGETILVVDDEPPIVRLLNAQLTSAGYRVAAFTSSREALDSLASSPDRYDMVISDLTMPEITGDRLSFEIRTIRPDIPFILLTGKNTVNRLSRKITDNISALLTKPVNKQTLLKTIKESFR